MTMNVEWKQNVLMKSGQEFGRVLLRNNRWRVEKYVGDSVRINLGWRETAEDAKLALELETTRL